MPLPSWISEEFDWLQRELKRLNQEVQAFGKRVGSLERLLQDEFAQQSSPPQPPQVSADQSFAALAESINAATSDRAATDSNVPIEIVEVAPIAAAAPVVEMPPPRPVLLGSPPPLPERKFVAPRSRTDSPSIDWEKVIGEKWMTWVGGFTLLLAIGFGVQWAWERFQAPPWLQVSGLHLLGFGLLAGGYYLHRRKMPILGQGVLGLGLFTLYASAYAALRLYKLWNEDIAFLEGAAITILAIGVAVRANSPGVILLGALGGYLTPILTSTGSGNYVGLFSYLAFLNVALVACAVWKAWNFVKPLALVATAIMFVLWVGSSHYDASNSSTVWGTEWFAVLHASIFLIGSTIPPLLWQRTSTPADLLALTMNSLLFMGFTWLQFHRSVYQQLALVSWGMTALHGLLFGLTYARVTNVDRMPRFHLALAAIFFTLAVPLQIDDSAYWGATWCVQAFIFTAVGVWFRDRQMCVSAMLVFLLAAARLLVFDFTSPARDLGGTYIDLRFLLLFVSGVLALLASNAYRLIPWVLGRFEEVDEWLRSIPSVLTIVGAVLLTFAPPLQVDEKIYLAPAWSLEAFAFTLIGLVIRDRLLCAAGIAVFAVAGLRLLDERLIDLVPVVFSTRGPGSYSEPPSLLTSSGWNKLFLATTFSSAVALVSSALYWLIPRAAWRDCANFTWDRTLVGGLLAAIANLALMVGATFQWDGRVVLLLWTLDAGVVWAVGFRLDRPAVRWYAAVLGIGMVGARAIHEGYGLDGPFQLIFNERFGSLLLVALLYFVFGGLYRRRFRGQGGVGLLEALGFRPRRTAQQLAASSGEAECDPVLGILANLTLVTAISFEIHSWYAQAAQAGSQPFGNMVMAEKATYSIAWAIYAALMVVAGFILRYPLFRIMGLAAFAPILLKVFLSDLSSLKWLPRVLALAVLGMMLLGVSMLYQKFAARLKESEQRDGDADR